MEMTAEQKVLVLTHQRRVLAAQVAVRDAEKNLQSVFTDYNNVVNQLITELKIDTTRHRLDLDNMIVVDIPQPEPAEV